MSPRPRETSDEQILAATGRVMQRRSPAQLTLADIAREAGVAPATLIQRFGTKRGLLLTLCRTAPRAIPPQVPAQNARRTLRPVHFLRSYPRSYGQRTLLAPKRLNRPGLSHHHAGT